MLSRPSYARVTLALDIIKRLDSGPWRGYHELAVIKHQIDLHDVIGVEPWPTLSIACENPQVPRNASNVCWKAAEALAARQGAEPRVRIHIEKKLPVQGGLAGGSSNAATVLLLLNDLWKLKLTNADLAPVARSIGMDVPYFLTGATAFDSEAGGCLRPIPTALQFHFVLVFPAFGVSTAAAYRGIDVSQLGALRNATAEMERSLYIGDTPGVIRTIHNAFEDSVFAAYPELMQIRNDLRAAGALAAGMSGSGSTMFGIAESRRHAEEIAARLQRRTAIAASAQYVRGDGANFRIQPAA